MPESIVVVVPNENSVIEINDTENTVIVANDTQSDTLVVDIGRPGPTVYGSPFEWLQSAPSTVWTITHNLGRYPTSISTWDTGDTLYIGSIRFIDLNTIEITFSAAISGRAEIL